MTVAPKPIIEIAQQTLQLRAVIAALGEAVDPPWWRTEFMTEAGMRFLERLYPRTAFKAAVNATGKAACDAHDHATGRVGVYHLFRLPETLEAEIYRLQPAADDEFVTRFRAVLGQPEALVGLLDSLRGTAVAATDVAGAVKVDVSPDHVGNADLAAMASVYFAALNAGKQAFPYFLSPEPVE
ncbi:MAG: BrxE family protein [Thermoleophilia bacterium]|nr:BrxE family protein [Thermoleophilia bacterium]